MPTITLHVDGMHCGGCENTVVTRLGRVAGVRSVEADHETGTVTVRFVAGKDDADALREAVGELPYELQDLERA